MPDDAPRDAAPTLTNVLAEWRARPPGPGTRDKPLHCWVPSYEFRALGRLAAPEAAGLAGVVVLDRGAKSVLLQVEGLGAVRVMGSKPTTLFGAIAEVCDRVARDHEARAAEQRPD